MAHHRLPKIPEMTIRRLSVYTRCLLQLEEDGVKTISSQELAERFSLNSAQVRKDLAYFGEFGVRGIGYYVSGLKAELQRILGLDREWAVALVGFGNLGSALFHYKGFARQGFRIAVVIDDDPAKIGREIESVPVVPSRDMAREIKARGVQIAWRPASRLCSTSRRRGCGWDARSVSRTSTSRSSWRRSPSIWPRARGNGRSPGGGGRPP
jgi:NADH/NAD ratio-sensing transcriptional regulator Rex